MTALAIRNLPLLCRLLHCPSGGGSDDSLAEAYQVLRTLSGKRRISQLCFASCGCCKLSHPLPAILHGNSWQIFPVIF